MRRHELHRRVAEAIEELFADRLGEFYAILAEHFLHGEAWEKAVSYFILAGDAAARLYAHAEARLHYAKALDAFPHLTDDTENQRRRVDTTVKLVTVSLMSDNPRINLTRLHGVEPVAQELPSEDGTPGGDWLRLARVHLLMAARTTTSTSCARRSSTSNGCLGWRSSPAPRSCWPCHPP